MDNSVLEKKICQALEKKSEEVCVDALTSQRIQSKVFGNIEEERNMKHGNWKKAAVVTAAICIFGTMTVMALGKPAFVMSSSSHDEEIKSYGEAVKTQKEYDAQVKAVEEFSNGYRFKYAVPMHQEVQDQDRNQMAEEISVSYTYGKEGMEDVIFSGSRISVGEEGEPDQIVALEDGTELHYSRTVNKFVPADYEISEEEKKLQEEGKLNVGYGSDTVEIKNSSCVIWVQDGITYSLFAFGDDLAAEEMLTMAKEVAES